MSSSFASLISPIPKLEGLSRHIIQQYSTILKTHNLCVCVYFILFYFSKTIVTDLQGHIEREYII